ncbi:hypothetical protein CCM_03164 [Cordyceps militaris CM01]|uniref:Uncharacterized protein n=1 Tax=Cordyceps militaris (strain CM01) TaxID=983644 RepID=G3J964_CORMM|nr:uncharacterized protein CCM_03164 [Cordyceps militaris CM01]EGX94893.1 hypothetical protein CCM_03164 [Cordyceps militaris CM01]
MSRMVRRRGSHPSAKYVESLVLFRYTSNNSSTCCSEERLGDEKKSDGNFHFDQYYQFVDSHGTFEGDNMQVMPGGTIA